MSTASVEHPVLTCVLASLLVSVFPQKGPSQPPSSEAVLSGTGDVYSRKLLGKAQLGGTGFDGLADLAGSWVYLYEVKFDPAASPELRGGHVERIEKANALVKDHAEHGLVVIAVTRSKRNKDDGYPPLNHPLWVTSDLNLAGDGKPALLDRMTPSALLIDPLGLIAEGGRTLLGFGVAKIGFASRTQGHPGLALSEVPPGDPLRKAIAARNWATARKLAATRPAVQERLEAILASQVSWVEAHCAANDPCSAAARLALVEKLPEGDPLLPRVTALRSRLSEDPDLTRARELQSEALALAASIEESPGYRAHLFSEKEYQKLDKAASALEGKSPSDTAGVMAVALREQIESKSPLRPCPRCKNPVKDCTCK